MSFTGQISLYFYFVSSQFRLLAAIWRWDRPLTHAHSFRPLPQPFKLRYPQFYASLSSWFHFNASFKIYFLILCWLVVGLTYGKFLSANLSILRICVEFALKFASEHLVFFLISSSLVTTHVLIVQKLVIKKEWSWSFNNYMMNFLCDLPWTQV